MTNKVDTKENASYINYLFHSNDSTPRSSQDNSVNRQTNNTPDINRQYILNNLNRNEFYNGVKDEIIQQEIQKIFDINEINDLISLLQKRKIINNSNMMLMYVFHFVQSSGILITTIASGYGNTSLVWLGVSLNALASLINVIEKNNNTMLKKLMKDIKNIKNGNYIDEAPIYDSDEKSIDTENINTNNNKQQQTLTPNLSRQRMNLNPQQQMLTPNPSHQMMNLQHSHQRMNLNHQPENT